MVVAFASRKRPILSGPALNIKYTHKELADNWCLQLSKMVKFITYTFCLHQPYILPSPTHILTLSYLHILTLSIQEVQSGFLIVVRTDTNHNVTNMYEKPINVVVTLFW